MEDKDKLSLDDKEIKLNRINKLLDDGELQIQDGRREQMKMSDQFIDIGKRNNMMDSVEFKDGYNSAMELFDDRNFELKRAMKYLYEEHDNLKKSIDKEKD